MGLFEDVAFSHCECTGWDVFRLRKAGFGWIMIEGGFEMMRYPRYREAFTIETWLEGARMFYGSRGFEVKDESGLTIGRARSLWIFYDLAKHRPAPVFEDILKCWKPDPGVVPARGAPGGGPVGGEPAALPPDCVPSFDVRALDIDTNGHVNNVRYLEWALESVPPAVRDGYRLVALQGRFIHEVVRGQCVTPVSVFEQYDADTLDCRLSVYASGLPVSSPGVAACASATWIKKV